MATGISPGIFAIFNGRKWYASQPAGELALVRTTIGTADRNAEVEHQVFKHGEQSMGLVIDQDMAIFSEQQKGFRSRSYSGVDLSGQESRVRRYHEVIDGARTAKNNTPLASP
jgi:hypothetical protein